MILKYIVRTIYILLLFVFAAGHVTAPAQATSDSAELRIDKTIYDPRGNGQYVDSLLYDDYRFSPGEDIIFKVVVENKSENTLHNVTITDTIPPVTNMLILSGEERPEIREITKDWGSVEPGGIREWFFRLRVTSAEALSDDVVCEGVDAVNYAVVSADNVPEHEDSSSFCVKRPAPSEREEIDMQPETGASVMSVSLILSGIASTGFVLRKII